MTRSFLVGFVLILMSSMPAFGQGRLGTQRLTADALEGLPADVVALARIADEEAEAVRSDRIKAIEMIALPRAELDIALKKPISYEVLEVAFENFAAAYIHAFSVEKTLREKDSVVRRAFEAILLPTEEQKELYRRWDVSVGDNYVAISRDYGDWARHKRASDLLEAKKK